jgi:hypothetical protein
VWDTGRNTTIDNWFASVVVMLLNHGLTILGTIKKNKREIHPLSLNGKIRPPFSTMFGFRNKSTLVACIPQEGKVVSILHETDPALIRILEENRNPR